MSPSLCVLIPIGLVQYLQQLVDVERIQFRICLSFLLEVRAIGLIDMFDICNIYVLQDFEALWNEEKRTILYN